MTTYTIHPTDGDLSGFLYDNLGAFNGPELVEFVELIGYEDEMFDLVMRWVGVDGEAVVTETDHGIEVSTGEDYPPFITFPK